MKILPHTLTLLCFVLVVLSSQRSMLFSCLLGAITPHGTHAVNLLTEFFLRWTILFTPSKWTATYIYSSAYILFPPIQP